METNLIVPGADEREARRLGALGGVAAQVAEAHVLKWPEQLRTWASKAPTPPSWLIDAVREEMGCEVDVLAALYNACISPPHRRRLGTVFTPAPVVDHMLIQVDRQLRSAPAYVIDPGAGVGAFTIAASRHWPAAQVVAVDINVVTLGLLATRIAFEIDAVPHEAEPLERIKLVLGDYLHELADLYQSDPNAPIAAVGNPPYTRIQELPTGYRQRASEIAGEIIDSRHANLALLFQAATLKHMRPIDVSCMILPGSFSYTRASRGLRHSLWHSRRHVEIHHWPVDKRAFMGRSVQAAILTVGSVKTRRSALRLARVKLANPSIEISQSRTLSRTQPEPANWFLPQQLTPNKTGNISLSEIATIRRGIATGATHMFFVDDAVAAELPADVLVAGIPTLRGLTQTQLDSRVHASWGGATARRWLLAIPPDRQLTGRLREYIVKFESEVKSRYLPSKRNPWYSLSLQKAPALLISPLSKSGFKVVSNIVGAVPSNNLYGISPVEGVDAVALATWLRSGDGQQELHRVSHRYPGGSFKLELSALASLRIPRDFSGF